VTAVNGYDRDVNAIEVRGVGFAYDDEPILRSVSFDVHEREFVSVLGPNGSGKSTLLKLILGLLKPGKGEIRIYGQRPDKARRMVGYMPQHAHLDPHFPATVTDVVLMGRIDSSKFLGFYSRADKAAAIEALEKVDLAGCRNRPFSDLSGGQRQRALIARALAGDPRILIMDEPTAGLDSNAEAHLYELLRELNKEKTIMLVSHDVGVVSKLVDSVVCVQCDAGIHPTSELTGDMLNAMYGGDVKMVLHDHRCAEEGDKCTHS